MMYHEPFVEFVRDQLRDLGTIQIRRMFGSFGLYAHGVFFGIISDGELYFKTNDQTRPEYEAFGMAPFRPNAHQTLKTYYAVPPDILEDSEQLVVWAERAIRCASDKLP
ncbi:MAG: hypothetical protein KatS3mg057_0087 [Herpetosiphonaceae bacterium]|nr:MAG: hypothetical protein KatS3mg057_0087 [Herpetosiphonaceae bacterium]